MCKIYGYLKYLFFFVLILILIFPPVNFGRRVFEVFAQLSPQEERQSLERELKQLEEKIAQYEKDITKTEEEKKTLQNQIYSLKKKIEKLDLQIYQSNLMIKELGFQIKDTEISIQKTSLKIEDCQQRLAHILRAIYEEDQRSFVEVLLSEPKISDFFDNLIALESLSSKNQELLEEVKALKSDLGEQKESLSEEKEDTERVAKIQTLQKQQSEEARKEQEQILKMTEAQYQKYLKEKQEMEKKAAEIRARIFELVGVTKAPTFGEALEIAKYAANLTGIRPAFLLAILQQESAIGKNVGQCYLTNPTTGEGVRVSTGAKAQKTMNPTRDVPHFLSITEELGRDPYKTFVSCPMSYGWGGAMGPAQFIPSTWARYRDRLSAILGRAADPWNIKDSFLAAALYLSDYGAKTKTEDGEWKAAMIYFSGSTKNSAFYWYANNVLKIAAGFEKDIEAIEKSQ